MMANPKGNEQNLVKFKAKWKTGATQTIRVPIAISEEIITIAKYIDSGELTVKDINLLVREKQKQKISKLLNEVLTLDDKSNKKAKEKIADAIALLESLTE